MMHGGPPMAVKRLCNRAPRGSWSLVGVDGLVHGGQGLHLGVRFQKALSVDGWALKARLCGKHSLGLLKGMLLTFRVPEFPFACSAFVEHKSA